jgi:hypothetical protein
MADIPILKSCQILNGKWYNGDSRQALEDLGFTIKGTTPDSNSYMVQLPAGWTVERVAGEMYGIKDTTGTTRIVHWYGVIPQVNIG